MWTFCGDTWFRNSPFTSTWRSFGAFAAWNTVNNNFSYHYNPTTSEINGNNQRNTLLQNRSCDSVSTNVSGHMIGWREPIRARHTKPSLATPRREVRRSLIHWHREALQPIRESGTNTWLMTPRRDKSRAVIGWAAGVVTVKANQRPGEDHGTVSLSVFVTWSTDVTWEGRTHFSLLPTP